MTGVPRYIVEHSLSILPNLPLVTQKKRKLAPDRAKAASSEVQKLVEAGILREARYHTWVANPVMVKKGGWHLQNVHRL
jgi:hypothetical protein